MGLLRKVWIKLKTGPLRPLFYKKTEMVFAVGRAWVDKRSKTTYIIVEDGGKPFDITKYLIKCMNNGELSKGNKK